VPSPRVNLKEVLRTGAGSPRIQAAAQLDQKSLRDFSGLEQCSQKAPESGESPNGALIVRKTSFRSTRPTHGSTEKTLCRTIFYKDWSLAFRSEQRVVFALWEQSGRRLIPAAITGAFCEDCSNPNFPRSGKWLSSAAAISAGFTATVQKTAESIETCRGTNVKMDLPSNLEAIAKSNGWAQASAEKFYPAPSARAGS
jgi:hypothetical protein